MMFRNIHVRDSVWTYTFMKGSLPLPTDDVDDIMASVVEMHLDNETRRYLNSPRYEGYVYTENKHAVIADIGGKVVHGQISTDNGEFRFGILLDEIRTYKAEKARLN